MTPSFIGRIASMPGGVRPSISFARSGRPLDPPWSSSTPCWCPCADRDAPRARTRSTPLPGTQTSALAVPKVDSHVEPANRPTSLSSIQNIFPSVGVQRLPGITRERRERNGNRPPPTRQPGRVPGLPREVTLAPRTAQGGSHFIMPSAEPLSEGLRAHEARRKKDDRGED
jgi:hypothetical protein